MTRRHARLAALTAAFLTTGALTFAVAPADAVGGGPAPKPYTDADAEPVIATDPAGTTAATNQASKISTDSARVAAAPAADAAEEHARVSGFNHNDKLSSKNDITRTPSGGKSGTFRARGYSYVKVPFIETSANFTNSSADVYWLGLTPINAKSVLMTESWKTSGFSISLSVPPGASFSGSGGTASDQSSASNVWQVHSSVDSVRFSGAAIVKVRHTVAGKFQFGASWFTTVTTTDSSIV